MLQKQLNFLEDAIKKQIKNVVNANPISYIVYIREFIENTLQHQSNFRLNYQIVPKNHEIYVIPIDFKTALVLHGMLPAEVQKLSSEDTSFSYRYGTWYWREEELFFAPAKPLNTLNFSIHIFQ